MSAVCFTTPMSSSETGAAATSALKHSCHSQAEHAVLIPMAAVQAAAHQGNALLHPRTFSTMGAMQRPWISMPAAPQAQHDALPAPRPCNDTLRHVLRRVPLRRAVWKRGTCAGPAARATRAASCERSSVHSAVSLAYIRRPATLRTLPSPVIYRAPCATMHGTCGLLQSLLCGSVVGCSLLTEQSRT